MSADEDFEEARRRIAVAKRDGARRLDLSGLRELADLPEEIAALDLTSLDLRGTQVSDISPLAGMTGMTELDLMNTQVSDISPLAGMTGMTELDLMNTQVSDISPLAGMTGMTSLDLMNTQVSDISPLAGMTGMASLTLSGTQVSDISPLAGMTGMASLNLWSTQVSDISPLAGMTGMTVLTLSDTQVSDISPLAGMTGMTVLDLMNTQVSDISPLAGMTGMASLSLMNTQVSDISPLAGMTGMTVLTLSDTQVSDISPLASMTGMTSLTLSDTQVSDISPLAGMTGMTSLTLSDTQVNDLRPLVGLNKLEAPEILRSGALFSNTPATILDPTLAEIAEIEDDVERGKRLFARLREIGDDWPPIPPDAPEQAGAPRIDLVDDQIDLKHNRPDAEEIADPVKQKALERLRSATTQLLRVGNRYPDIDSAARGLNAQIEPDLAEMDLLEVHFDLEILRGIYERRSERGGEDVLDAESVSALERVGLVGPGLTLDNADVEQLEDRRRRYRDAPPSADQRAAQDRLSASIAKDDTVYGKPLRDRELRFSLMEVKSDRLVAGQSDANRNVVIVVGTTVVNGVFWGVAGGPLSTIGNNAMAWLVANSETILTLAPAWGDAFQAWITPVIMRAREAAAGIAQFRKTGGN